MKKVKRVDRLERQEVAEAIEKNWEMGPRKTLGFKTSDSQICEIKSTEINGKLHIASCNL